MKLLVLDWNGTLLNDLHVAYGSVLEIFKRHNLSAPTLDQYRDEITSDFMKFYYKHGFPAHLSGDQLNLIRKEYFEMHWNTPQLQDGTVELLLYCESVGIPCILVSAEIPKVLQDRVDQFGIGGCFAEVQGGAWPTKHKILGEILARYELMPEDLLYVGDTVDDVETCVELGIPVVGFCAGYHTGVRILESEATYAVDSLREVVTIIKQRIRP